MSTTRCSVVIPTRDCLQYLREAIASAAMQNIPDLEIIVVDDGSSDGTGEWLHQAAKADSRIRAFRSEGVGPSEARNIAISQSLAPLIAFLDADDVWWPRKLERQLAFHEDRKEIAFSFTDYLHVDPDCGLYGTCFEYWKPSFITGRGKGFFVIPDAEYELLASNVAGTSTVVARKDALQNANGFANGTLSAEDWDLWLRLAAEAPVACSTGVTASYLMRPDSVTQNKPARVAAMEMIVARYAGRPEAKAREAVRRASQRLSIAKAELERSRHRYLAAACHHSRAFFAAPSLREARAAAFDLVNATKHTGRAGLRQ